MRRTSSLSDGTASAVILAATSRPRIGRASSFVDRRARRDDRPVPQYGDAIGEAADLREAMAHVEDSDALGLETAQRGEEPLDVTRHERRRGLVEHEAHLRWSARADRDERPIPGAQLADARAYVDAEPGEALRRQVPRLPPGDRPEVGWAPGPRQREVVGDR